MQFDGTPSSNLERKAALTLLLSRQSGRYVVDQKDPLGNAYSDLCSRHTYAILLCSSLQLEQGWRASRDAESL